LHSGANNWGGGQKKLTKFENLQCGVVTSLEGKFKELGLSNFAAWEVVSG